MHLSGSESRHSVNCSACDCCMNSGNVKLRDLKPENSHPSGMGRQADRQRDPTPACLTHQQTLLLTAAPQGSEAIAAGCAAVTAAAEDVGLALTLPGQHLAHAAAGALRVALAGCGAAGDERPTHSRPLIPAAPDSRRAPSCSMAETLQIRRAQASARACGGTTSTPRGFAAQSIPQSLQPSVFSLKA